MTELLPTRQAMDLRRAITDYVSTAIALADPSVATALDAFLEDEDSGIFLGPYLRTRLPFAGGTGEEAARQHVPSLPEGFVPYAHQAKAFGRLTTVPDAPGKQDEAGFRLPEPAIVTTGTGSGKTESFLFPVLDHVARARQAGIGGMKALILYPMNALANDQAGRLAKAITSNPAYQGITAALYTGEASAQPSTVVTENGLITDREMIRGSVPDILLTNYKMLDQLLLRRADRPLWGASGASLRYLVLDEFHTYDGAQGTDVGILLRRLDMVLETAAPGRVHVTPVATSATLGDGAEAADAMLEFASTVFGTEIGPDAVITESRVPLEEFLAPAINTLASAGDGERSLLVPATLASTAMEEAIRPHLAPGSDLDPDALTRDVLDALWRSDEDPDASATQLASRHGIGPRELLLAHPLVADLLRATAGATALDELARDLFPAVTDDQIAEDFTTALLAVLSHERAREGAPRNSFPNLEAHLWLREISRVDRVVATAPSFRWSDAVDEDGDLALPAIYCRHCGRSGWGATTRAVGDDLDLSPDRVRRDAFEKKGRFRALILDISSTGEDQDHTSAETSRRRYLNLDSATLDLHGPTEDDPDPRTLRVLAHAS
ncbi:MAG: DEAD/DEAH box helicase, partial [Dermabacteraceae bacterium]